MDNIDFSEIDDMSNMSLLDSPVTNSTNDSQNSPTDLTTLMSKLSSCEHDQSRVENLVLIVKALSDELNAIKLSMTQTKPVTKKK